MVKNMKAKIIHYCWFGGAPKSVLIEKCIESWRHFFPEYEIKEWNESNFDINHNLYVRQAYEMKKYAFVSDYVRFWALEQYGGLYFDTDAEVIRPFGELLDRDGFAGFETDAFIAPGLVLYVREPNHPVIRDTREWYDRARFLDDDGNRIKLNVCGIFTDILTNYGFVPNGKQQTCGGITLFPKDYFCPYDDATGTLHKTENTYAIHWYAKSWMPKKRVLRNRVTRVLHRVFGTDIRRKLQRLIGKK